jgi:hypothetical protein
VIQICNFIGALFDGIDECIDNNFTKTLLKAVFLLAFNSFLRLGEILVRSPKEAGSVIQKQDVSFTYCNRRPQSITMVIRHYKSIKNNQPVTITIEANHNNLQLCPVRAVHSHLENHSRVDVLLFLCIGGTPVTHSYVTGQLTFILKFLGIDPKFFKGHSFRIGAATHATTLGFSEPYIRQLGRWNSNAIQRYIRISSFNL